MRYVKPKTASTVVDGTHTIKSQLQSRLQLRCDYCDCEKLQENTVDDAVITVVMQLQRIPQ